MFHIIMKYMAERTRLFFLMSKLYFLQELQKMQRVAYRVIRLFV